MGEAGYSIFRRYWRGTDLSSMFFRHTIPVCRITASGALRCTPGSVANPLNRQGRFIAAYSCKTVKLKSVGILAGVTWHPCHRFDGVRSRCCVAFLVVPGSILAASTEPCWPA